MRALERAWEERFGSGHAVSMNSATSALNAAVAAVGVGPGDEVIVSPYTMSASATCVLVNGAIPVTDLDEDAEPVRVFRNLGDGGFEEIAVPLRPLLGRGSAAADYDNDGDLDVAILELGGPLVLLENRGARGNRLTVALEGSPPGAEVTAVLPDGRTLRRTLQAGSSYLSSEDPRLHFGLGAAESVAELVVRRPGGSVERLRDVAANRRLTLEPGRGGRSQAGGR